MVMRYGIDGIGYMPATRSSNTTYIQNNFYGNSVYSGNANFGYNGYGCGCCGGYSGSCFGFGFAGGYPPPPPPHSSHHHCDDGELPGIAKWTLGIGVTSSLVGLGLKLFSKDS